MIDMDDASETDLELFPGHFFRWYQPPGSQNSDDPDADSEIEEVSRSVLVITNANDAGSVDQRLNTVLSQILGQPAAAAAVGLARMPRHEGVLQRWANVEGFFAQLCPDVFHDGAIDSCTEVLERYMTSYMCKAKASTRDLTALFGRLLDQMESDGSVHKLVSRMMMQIVKITDEPMSFAVMMTAKAAPLTRSTRPCTTLDDTFRRGPNQTQDAQLRALTEVNGHLADIVVICPLRFGTEQVQVYRRGGEIAPGAEEWVCARVARSGHFP